LLRRARAAEDLVNVRHHPLQLVRRGERDPTAYPARVATNFPKVALIESNRRREVRASRVAHQKNRARISTKLVRVLARPPYSECAVVDELGEAGVGNHPRVRQYRDVPRIGERRAHEAIPVLGAPLPESAVPEHHHRTARCAAWHVDVESLPAQLTIANVR